MKFKKFTSLILVLFLVAIYLVPLIPKAIAAGQVTSLSDTMSRLKASTASNHEIKFVTPTGVAAGQTIILTFSAGFTGVTNIAFGDIDFAQNSGSDCSAGSWTEKTLAATPSGATWGADGDSDTTVTLTSGTDTITNGRCVRIRIGTNATEGATGDTQISNGAIGVADTVTIGGTFTDYGTLAVEIIANDQVVITATVDPTLTFTISDNTIEFGALSSSAATWADDSGGSTSDVVAHTMTVATNATGGYNISYNGPTLTSSADTIDVASINDDANGVPGTEQFGVSYSTDGDATIATGYDHAGPDWTWVASTTTPIISETGPTATETISARYLANIAANTEAGAYTTTVTYVATATF